METNATRLRPSCLFARHIPYANGCKGREQPSIHLAAMDLMVGSHLQGYH